VRRVAHSARIFNVPMIFTTVANKTFSGPMFSSRMHRLPLWVSGTVSLGRLLKPAAGNGGWYDEENIDGTFAAVVPLLLQRPTIIFG
jgi:hypothetical protein